MPRLASLLCVLVFAAPAASEEAGGPVELRLKFTPGEAFDVETTTITESETAAGPLTILSLMTQRMTRRETVLSVAGDGSATVRDVLTRVRASNEMIGLPAPVEQEWDSDSGEAPPEQLSPIANRYRPLIGAERTYTMRPDGTATDFRLSEGYKAAVRSLPGMADATDEDIASGPYGGVNGTVVLPPGPVRVGDVWEDERSEAASDATIGKQTFTGFDAAGLAVIKGDYEVKLPDADDEAGGFSVEDSSGTVETLFDVQAGRIPKTTMTIEMTLRMKFGGQETRPKSKTTIEAVRTPVTQ